MPPWQHRRRLPISDVALGPLVTADWLASHLHADDLRIVDCRWYLGEPDRGPTAYREAHIPGAVYVHLDRDLSAPSGPGRHPLPEPKDFVRTLGAKGIAPATTVVAYDDRGGAIAARLWWMLRDLGHEKVAVLDGGLAAWPRDLLESGEVSPPAAEYVPATTGAMPRIDRTELADRLATSLTLDARARERYLGEDEPVDPVAGHIPSAVSAPLTDNLRLDGGFKSPQELAARFRELGAGAGTPVVSYCGSGVTACHNILAMELAGFEVGALYPGSWSDWSTSGMPVAVGPYPGRWPA